MKYFCLFICLLLFGWNLKFVYAQTSSVCYPLIANTINKSLRLEDSFPTANNIFFLEIGNKKWSHIEIVTLNENPASLAEFRNLKRNIQIELLSNNCPDIFRKRLLFIPVIIARREVDGDSVVFNLSQIENTLLTLSKNENVVLGNPIVLSKFYDNREVK